MNFLVIQEAGRHEANKHFRESLCLKNSINRIEGNKAEVWGKGYPQFEEFDTLHKWADVIFILENYTPEWLPIDKLASSKKFKVFWSIDSHEPLILPAHVYLHEKIRPNLHLNSTEKYLPFFSRYSDFTYWFPNAYPSDLIKPIPEIEKQYDLGFCGNINLQRQQLLNDLIEFNPKVDSFVIGENMVKAINSYKIHLNKNIRDDINYRTFETLGCKTFIITNYTPGLEKLFKIDSEIITWNTLPELKEKIKFYLDNPKKREEIENEGFKVVSSKHTYDSRCKYLLRIISGISK